jgi:hypothetical protein
MSSQIELMMCDPSGQVRKMTVEEIREMADRQLVKEAMENPNYRTALGLSGLLPKTGKAS